MSHGPLVADACQFADWPAIASLIEPTTIAPATHHYYFS